MLADSVGLALQRLLNRAVPQDKLPSVIETIVSNLKAADIVERLRGDDPQTFADIIDEARHHTISLLNNWSIKTLPDPLFLLFSHWTISFSHHISERNV